jgi:hypothetical protein
MRVMLTLDGRTEAGGTPLVMHHERLADPLDDHAREIAKRSKKRNKTDADHLEIARLEFLGGMYTNGNGPCLPAWNIIRCLQDGAKRTKRGRDVLRGVAPLVDSVDLAYDGPREPEVLWKEGGYSLRKTVGIRGSRTMRTRPIFVDWTAALPGEVDPVIFDPDRLAACWQDAGRYAGLGEMRPIHGKFLGTLTEWDISKSAPLGPAAYALACSVMAEAIEEDDEGRAARYADPAAVTANAEKLLAKLTKG